VTLFKLTFRNVTVFMRASPLTCVKLRTTLAFFAEDFVIQIELSVLVNPCFRPTKCAVTPAHPCRTLTQRVAKSAATGLLFPECHPPAYHCDSAQFVRRVGCSRCRLRAPLPARGVRPSRSFVPTSQLGRLSSHIAQLGKWAPMRRCPIQHDGPLMSKQCSKSAELILCGCTWMAFGT